ncbi:KxYKxGKxW signal peptide domain-containing protein [Loigolactobacillus coryniformis]
MENKKHFKMYKDCKHWVAAGIMFWQKKRIEK